MKIILFLVFLFAIFAQGQDIFAISPGAGLERAGATVNIIDSTTGITKASIIATLDGIDLIGGVVITWDSNKQNLYIIVEGSPVVPPGIAGTRHTADRYLGTLDPTTGVITKIGVLSNSISSIAFDGGGNLYGVSGEFPPVRDAAPPETLYKIDPQTAAMTPVLTLGNGDWGEVIVYNSNNGLLYHFSGNNGGVLSSSDKQRGPVIMESINLNTLTVTAIPLSGYNGFTEIMGALYDSANDSFLVTSGYDIPYDLLRITTNGVVSQIDNLGERQRGIAPLIPVLSGWRIWLIAFLLAAIALPTIFRHKGGCHE